jgi:hypothetical protein
MITIIWPNGNIEAIHKDLLTQSLEDGALIATAEQIDLYLSWLDNC